MKAFSQYKSYLPLLISLLLFSTWAVEVYFQKPLVWDEIVSLTNFVLVSFGTTVTEYPDVNNHVFFNLVNNLYCKMLSVSDLYDAMDKIASIRLLPFALSVLTIFYTWCIGKRFFNSAIAGMAAIILITTLPFLNFTMQLRGYTFSATLLAMSTYHLLSFQQSAKWPHLLTSVLTVSALLYTIPSNVFFVLSLGLIFFIYWFSEGRKTSREAQKKKASISLVETWIKNRYFAILCAIGLSALIAYLLYLPILEDIMSERHLQQVKGKSFYAYNVQDLLPKVLYYLTSFRFLFAITTVIGLLALYRLTKRLGWKARSVYHAVFIFLLFMLPFVISLVRGDKTPQRSFVPLAMPFAILSALSIYSAFREVKFARRYPLALFGIVGAYCLLSFQWSVDNKNKVLHKAILDGDKLNTMMYNFYQSEDYGMEYLDPLIEDVKKTGLPIVMAREIDRVSEGEYLLKHDLNYYSTVWSKQVGAKNEQGYQYAVLLEISQGKGKRPGYQQITFPPQFRKEAGKFIPIFYYLMQNGIIDKSDPKCYVLTYAPRWFEGVMQDYMPQFKFERMSPKLSYHNVYMLSLKK